jgi:hypothetical protein
MQRVAPAPTISPMMYAIRILFIWFFFLGWLLFPDVFGCQLLGNLKCGRSFVVNSIEEGIKNFPASSAKLSDWRWSFIVRIKEIFYEVIKLL